MIINSKNYKLNTSKNKFFQVLKNKLRSPAEGWMVYHPFINRKCEWVTGKLSNNSFDLTDYRFSRPGIHFLGKVIENDSCIELITQIKFNNFLVIFQSFWIISLIIALYTVNNFQDRLGILIIILFGVIGNSLIIFSIIKGFYNFLDNQFAQNDISFELNYSSNA
jgi:hypothetical protein